MVPKAPNLLLNSINGKLMPVRTRGDPFSASKYLKSASLAKARLTSSWIFGPEVDDDPQYE